MSRPDNAGRLDLLPYEGIDEAVLACLEGAVHEAFGLETKRLPPAPAPDFAYDAGRRQYGSTEILLDVYRRLPDDDGLRLAIVDVDIAIPMLTFVFGQAQLGGRAALVSLARLRQEFYGLPPNAPLLHRRAAKTAMHELGHSLGLVHCLDPACVISLSTNVRQVDAKQEAFCAECAPLVERRLAALRAGTDAVQTREESG